MKAGGAFCHRRKPSVISIPDADRPMGIRLPPTQAQKGTVSKCMKRRRGGYHPPAQRSFNIAKKLGDSVPCAKSSNSLPIFGFYAGRLIASPTISWLLLRQSFLVCSVCLRRCQSQPTRLMPEPRTASTPSSSWVTQSCRAVLLRLLRAIRLRTVSPWPTKYMTWLPA